MTNMDDLRQQKQRIRGLAFADRRNQKGKDELSRQILARLMALPEYENAATVMFYVDVRSEVRTRFGIEGALDSAKRIVVPYCAGDHLDLFRLEAIEELEQNQFDLVLMDIQMPVMDGFEATRVIRDPQSKVLDHNIPIIAMTAHAMKEDRQKCLVAGMDDYISKPVEPNALFQIIKKQMKKVA